MFSHLSQMNKGLCQDVRSASASWYVPDTWFTLCTEHILYTFPITSRLLWDQKDSRWHLPFEIPDQSNPYRNP
jgi:hypothetical protein